MTAINEDFMQHQCCITSHLYCGSALVFKPENQISAVMVVNTEKDSLSNSRTYSQIGLDATAKPIPLHYFWSKLHFANWHTKPCQSRLAWKATQQNRASTICALHIAVSNGSRHDSSLPTAKHPHRHFIKNYNKLISCESPRIPLT